MGVVLSSCIMGTARTLDWRREPRPVENARRIPAPYIATSDSGACIIVTTELPEALRLLRTQSPCHLLPGSLGSFATPTGRSSERIRNRSFDLRVTWQEYPWYWFGSWRTLGFWRGTGFRSHQSAPGSGPTAGASPRAPVFIFGHSDSVLRPSPPPSWSTKRPGSFATSFLHLEARCASAEFHSCGNTRTNQPNKASCSAPISCAVWLQVITSFTLRPRVTGTAFRRAQLLSLSKSDRTGSRLTDNLH